MKKEPKKNEINISRTQIIGLVIAAVIGSAVTTGFALLRIANSDHFTLIALGSRVSTIEDNFVPRTEYEQSSEYIDRSLQELRNNDIQIIQRLDRLLERL